MQTSKKIITALRVGEAFPTKLNMSLGQDMLGVLEMYFDEEGKTAQLFLIQSIANIQPLEKMILEKEKIHTKVYYRNDKMIFIFRYGKTSMMLESTFDASIYKNEMNIDFNQVDISNLMTIVRINPDTNVIESIRAASIPKKFKSRLEESIMHSVNMPGFTKSYREWITSLWNKYNSMQLWNLSEPTGYLGE